MLQPLQYSEPLIIRRFFGMHFSIFRLYKEFCQDKALRPDLKKQEASAVQGELEGGGTIFSIKFKFVIWADQIEILRMHIK